MSRTLQEGDMILVPMQIVGFESHEDDHKVAVKVKLPHSKKEFDHRLTQEHVILSGTLRWPGQSLTWRDKRA